MKMWKIAATRTLEWQKQRDPKMYFNAHYLGNFNFEEE